MPLLLLPPTFQSSVIPFPSLSPSSFQSSLIPAHPSFLYSSFQSLLVPSVSLPPLLFFTFLIPLLFHSQRLIPAAPSLPPHAFQLLSYPCHPHHNSPSCHSSSFPVLSIYASKAATINKTAHAANGVIPPDRFQKWLVACLHVRKIPSLSHSPPSFIPTCLIPFLLIPMAPLARPFLL